MWGIKNEIVVWRVLRGGTHSTLSPPMDAVSRRTGRIFRVHLGFAASFRGFSSSQSKDCLVETQRTEIRLLREVGSWSGLEERSRCGTEGGVIFLMTKVLMSTPLQPWPVFRMIRITATGSIHSIARRKDTLHRMRLGKGPLSSCAQRSPSAWDIGPREPAGPCSFLARAFAIMNVWR